MLRSRRKRRLWWRNNTVCCVYWDEKNNQWRDLCRFPRLILTFCSEREPGTDKSISDDILKRDGISELSESGTVQHTHIQIQQKSLFVFTSDIFNPFLLYLQLKRLWREILSKMLPFQTFSSSVLISFPFKTLIELRMKSLRLLQAFRRCPPERTS